MQHRMPPEIPEFEQTPERMGKWEMLEAEFINSATHVALLPTNKIFIYGGSSLDRDEFEHPTLPRAEMLDMNVSPWKTHPITCDPTSGDLWCGGHTLLADGKLLFAGGTNYYPPASDPFYGGLREAYLFDPFTETWERVKDMQDGRWYPTLIRLADDRVLTLSGLQYRLPGEQPKMNFFKILYELIFKIKESIARTQEVYDPATKTWSCLKDELILPLYPRLHLLPSRASGASGDVFYSGVFNTHFLTPGRYPSAVWSSQTETWKELGGRHWKKDREEGISILLALRLPDYKPQIMIAGGGTHNVGRSLMTLLHNAGKDSWGAIFSFLTRVEDSVERIDLSQSSPRWELSGKMHHPRVHANGVLLPDGNVLVVGGMAMYGHHDVDMHSVVTEAELYNPSRNTWTRMAAQQKARVYHSTAILLPDGRVISMGSNPRSKSIEHSIEIFSPPYLFHGERPVITESPDQIAHNRSFEISIDHTHHIAQVVLMRPEVLTHVTNTDQRLLELEFKVKNDSKLEIEGPPSAAHMPRGYCMLFVLNHEGVPSVGKFMKLA